MSIIEAGGDVDAQDKDGCTAMHHAAAGLFGCFCGSDLNEMTPSPFFDLFFSARRNAVATGSNPNQQTLNKNHCVAFLMQLQATVATLLLLFCARALQSTSKIRMAVRPCSLQ
jgi:hypothetical protein